MSDTVNLMSQNLKKIRSDTIFVVPFENLMLQVFHFYPKKGIDSNYYKFN